MGISPITLRISNIARWISADPEQYSPTIHNAPRNTLPDLISPNDETSFSVMADRRAGNFSTTSRTKEMTSTAEGLFESPRKSMRTYTTLAATSENLMAQECMDWINNWRYSRFCSPSSRPVKFGSSQPTLSNS